MHSSLERVFWLGGFLRLCDSQTDEQVVGAAFHSINNTPRLRCECDTLKSMFALSSTTQSVVWIEIEFDGVACKIVSEKQILCMSLLKAKQFNGLKLIV